MQREFVQACVCTSINQNNLLPALQKNSNPPACGHIIPPTTARGGGFFIIDPKIQGSEIMCSQSSRNFYIMILDPPLGIPKRGLGSCDTGLP